MYARLLAMICLLFVSLSAALADSGVPASDTLEVYMKGQEASTPDVIAATNRELTALMKTVGYRLVWRYAADPPSSAGAENLVIVETEDALLIADRSRSQQVGDIVKLLEKQKRDHLL